MTKVFEEDKQNVLNNNSLVSQDDGDQESSSQARGVSNAYMKKDKKKAGIPETQASPDEARHETHNASTKTSNESAIISLTMLAAQYSETNAVFHGFGKSPPHSQYAFKQTLKDMNQKKQEALDNAMDVTSMIVATQDSNRKKLEPGVGMVVGQLVLMKESAAQAVEKLKLFDATADFSLTEVEREVGKYKVLLEEQNKVDPANPIKIVPNKDAPTETSEKQTKPAIDKLVEAIENDLASVEAGNGMDTIRVNNHALNLKDLGMTHQELIATHKKAIAAIVNRIGGMNQNGKLTPALNALLHFAR